ncbi:MAG: leucine-rich repeat domain-containing protein [Bacteroidaceae bacterium]|nr:leucine-rich repeat domain-containing protein [Bacteroidaceae bacterium]
MRKRTIAALITLIAFSSGIQAYDLEFQGLFYDIDFNSKTMTVVNPRPSYDSYYGYCSGRITIPSSIKFGDNDYKVTAIGENAFISCSDLTAITIPNCITKIGRAAFCDCTSLSRLNIPESISEIDNSAFYYCENIDTLIWDNDNVVFSKWLFEGLPGPKHVIIGKIKTDYRPFEYCENLTSATILDGTTYIQDGLFGGCSGLTDISIPESVTAIGDGAFWDCTGLTSIDIPDGVTAIGNAAFKYCSNLKSFIIPAGIKTIEPGTFSDCSSLSSIIIPESVTRIEAGAFEYCSDLSSVVLPDNLSFIGSNAFGYSGLTDIDIPAHVDSIGIYYYENQPYILNPFSGCSNLRSITVDSNNKKYDSRNNCNAIIETASNTLLACANLTTITIPESVTSIDGGAFSGCSALSSIQVDPNNTVYDSRENCNAIIETKSNKLILGCKTTTIPETVTDINELAFINGIEWGEDEPEGVLYMNDLLYGYKGTMPQGTHIKVREGTKRIASSAFSGCTGLTSIIIPESVTSIGSCAFNGCTGLKSVTIPGSVTTIEHYVFEGCSNLASVYFQDGVNRIASSAFYGCNNIKTISIPESVSYLDGMDFYSDIDSLFWNSPNISPSVIKNNYGRSLKYVSIGSKVVQIEESAFYDCYNLDSVFISDGVKVIGDKAFSGCGRLKSIKIPQSVTSIGNSAFSGCTGLTSIIIPESVTSIGDGAFDGCNAFPEGVLYINDILYKYFGQMPQDTSITVRDGTTRIASGAFSCYTGWTSISIIIPESVTSIGDGAFYGRILKSITIPKSVTSIGDRAFDLIDTLYWDNTYCDYSHFSYNKIVFGDNYIKHRGLEFARGTEWYNSLPDGPVYLDNWLVGYKGIIPDNTQIDIKEGTIGIATQAFYSYEDSEDEGTITSVTIPESVTTIEHGAFFGCGISAITIPKSVTSIGEGPFYNCPYLTTICVDPENSVYDSRDNCNAIIETASNTLIQGCSNTTIPENVTSIGTEAFSYCTNLTSIVIPDGVTTIGDYAFSNCDNLKDINIPSSVKSIDRSAFSGCIGLSSIPDGLTYIGDYAFEGCTGITSVTIPEDITYIGSYAFKYCAGIKTVSLPASMGGKVYFDVFGDCSDIESIYLHSSTPISIYDFYDIDFDNCILYVPAGSKETYRKHSFWSSFKNIRLLDECGLNIDGICYEITSDIEKTVSVVHHNYKGAVNIPSSVIFNGTEYSVTGIASEAFSECDELVSVTIPQSVTEIEQGSFEGCHALTEIIFKGSPIINKDVFIDCPNIEKVVSTNITPGTMRLYNPFIAGDCETILKDNRNYCLALFDKNSNRYISSLNFSYPNNKTIINNGRIPAGEYKVTIGILPSDKPNYFHPVMYGLTDSSEVVIYDPINQQSFGETPIYYSNDPSGYDSVAIADTLVIPSEYKGIRIDLESGVKGRYIREYSSHLLLDRIFFEPIGNDFPQESYCGPFTESVFNNATLYVPENAVSTYREADGWKLFKNIAIDTKVEPVHMDNRDSTDNPVIYDMLGRKIMSDSLERLQPGLYIINGKKYLKSHM